MPATTIDNTSQAERDLRSASRGFKRDKDSRAKWALGHRPYNREISQWMTLDTKWKKSEPGETVDEVAARLRPWNGQATWYGKDKSNVNKADKHTTFDSRSEHHMKIQSRNEYEILDYRRNPSFELQSPAHDLTLSLADDTTYSFDAQQGPYQPQTLDTYIKTDQKAVDRMLRQEYEILDGNGQTLRGRKARQTLRRADGSRESGAAAEVDGFELV